MTYGITGWSGGPRQSLTHNLRAGQFRSMGRVNVFPSNTTIINNNNFGAGYGMYDDCYCNNSNSTPGWLNWMMGIGLGGTLLGGILGMFTGGNKTEGAGEVKTDTSAEKEKATNKKLDEFEGLKAGYPEGKFFKVDDKYCCRIGDNVYEADSLVDLNNQLKAAIKPSTTEPKTEKKDGPEKKDATETTLPKLFKDMSSFTTAEAVTDKFKELTGADAVKIDNIDTETITLSNVYDKENNTNMADKLKINTSTLKGIPQNGTKKLGNYKGKEVIAENLDGYIRIKVGDEQTYIIGKASDNTYQGYQTKELDVVGAGPANWHNQ